MHSAHQQKITAVLESITVPYIGLNCASLAELSDDGKLCVTLPLGLPLGDLTGAFKAQVEQALSAIDEPISLELIQAIPSCNAGNTEVRIAGVKNIIAVASGKGGVGKSTVSANLATALGQLGAKVGLLDADIYGPSQAHMFGLTGQRPEVIDNANIKPLSAHGVAILSMGNLVTENTPMIWRGPMVSGALKQLLNQAVWPDLDYLVIDLPPGTGDIQLTLSQSVPVSTSVIVTTPQDIALLDAKKAIEMFRKVSIPVAGVVENMSVHVCANCGHEEAIFGEHGGESLAEEFDCTLLGRLPLHLDVRKQADSGKPIVVASPESPLAAPYRDIAMQVAAEIWSQAREGQKAPQIVIDD